MRLETFATESVTVTMTTRELSLVNNALNEICNGVSDVDHDGEFATRVGWTREEARSVLREVHAMLDRLRTPSDEDG